ncbi:threonine-phosphate decarboxylase CobD [Bacillus andreraoultii]|uniref:threonine-phosphate decarboxylase CobD n=1 Tax=Bacillus andreraoultii TaxID=1499685 RepID=UPI00053966E8|nr:threonine-phosphate decarboxylase CobD [Bacillus andreraoultii]
MKWPSHGSNPHYLYEAIGMEKPEIVYDFSANINPLGPPANLRENWNALFSTIQQYPDPDATSLKEKIVEQGGIGPDQLLIGNGGAEIIALIGHWLRGKRVMIVEPTFSEYEQACRTNHCEVTYFYMKETGEMDVTQLIAQLPNKDALFLCNPNNPTGTCLEKQVIEEILTACEQYNCYFMIDEAFYDFVTGYESLVPLLKRFPNLILIRSMTKMFAIPGLRLGYTLANRSVIKSLANLQAHWSVNRIAICAGELVLHEEGFIERTRKLVDSERERLFQFYRENDFEVSPSKVNFYLLRDRTLQDQWPLFQFLLKEGIVPRHTFNFPGLKGRWLRFAIRSEHENTYVIEAMRKWRVSYPLSL